MSETEKMIEFESARFGKIEIPESDIIHAPEGIIGFPRVTRYALLDPSGGQSLFLWLQAIDEPKLAFIITDPMMFVPGYAIDRAEPDLDRIGVSEKHPPALFAIVTVPPDNPDGITANLLAPLLFFEKDNLLYQIVVERANWSIKEPLMRSEGSDKSGEAA